MALNVNHQTQIIFVKRDGDQGLFESLADPVIPGYELRLTQLFNERTSGTLLTDELSYRLSVLIVLLLGE
jgi:hypothetical protein